MSTFKVVVDRERCIGMGVCVLTAPDVFDQSDEEGKVFIRPDADPSRQQALVREAVSNCPSRALSIVES